MNPPTPRFQAGEPVMVVNSAGEVVIRACHVVERRFKDGLGSALRTATGQMDVLGHEWIYRVAPGDPSIDWWFERALRPLPDPPEHDAVRERKAEFA